MKFAELSTWVEAHPGESIVIGGGGLIFLLWLFGAFSSKSTDSGASSLAAAYYAAEAQQAVVGGQIQQATIGAARDTAVAGIQANAATAINAANTGAAMTINGQNTGAATTINAAQVSGQQAIALGLGADQLAAMLGLSSDQLQATYSNNDTAYKTALANFATFQAVNQTNANANLMSTAMHTVLPIELAIASSGGDANVAIPGLGMLSVGPAGAISLKALQDVLGYSPEQAAQAAGLVYPSPGQYTGGTINPQG